MKHIIIFMFAASTVCAQTNISGGNISAATWTKDGSPYYILGTVTVDSVLVIAPGVRIIFKSKRDGSHVSIDKAELGRIYAVGTEKDSITFQSFYDDYKWGGLGAAHGGKYQNVFKYCVFEMGESAVWATTYDPLKPDTVSHCTFRNNSTCIEAPSRSIVVTDCIFEGNTSVVEYFDYGGQGASLLRLTHCTIQGNEEGIQIAGREANAIIRNCIITDNIIGIDIPLGKNVVVGGAPEYCNRIYNNIGRDGERYNLTRSGKYGFLDARYNYWGSTNKDSISSTIWIQYPDSAAWIPFNDANCNPVPVGVNTPPDPSIVDLHAYPNPIRQGAPVEIAFTLERPATVTLSVHDMLGREVYRESIRGESSGTHTLSTSSLLPGVYFYTLLPGDAPPYSGQFTVLR